METTRNNIAFWNVKLTLNTPVHGQLKEYEIMICYQKFPESIGQPHVSCIPYQNLDSSKHG